MTSYLYSFSDITIQFLSGIFDFVVLIFLIRFRSFLVSCARLRWLQPVFKRKRTDSVPFHSMWVVSINAAINGHSQLLA